ncbi:hypothetical protein TTHERM_00052690 (macronuclear) [Tetrahymena thermophila SB210]|uniref:Uncharacterized protein n=1 Tax=Tetrahymena thermophila (strain SB210) TaxID=312017 RepID=Q23CS1_TETTS|nr:hypothetical protein TTHERM_00052690 [Tetrahymena thermophila SB210]EAR94720.1 hypothetical protein TTHERM_00052690 [Tetrahymena thermophila SB210]|eukprot:XP_001014965.1 hypothetical protein TTHERM_00052690 [Tetrahymena thermophila SB210]
MDLKYSQAGNYPQRSISPVRFDDDRVNYQPLQNSQNMIQQSYSSPQKFRTKPQIFQSPSYLQQTATTNLSFGSPQILDQDERVLNNNLEATQQQIQQLLQDKESLIDNLSNLQRQILQLEMQLQQEQRINRSVATEYMIKLPSAEKKILELNAENQKLYEQIENEKRLCSQDYLKKLELENLRLTVKNKQLALSNENLQSQLQIYSKQNYPNSLKSSPTKKPFIQVSVNCSKDDEIEIIDDKQILVNKPYSFTSQSYKQEQESIDQNVESKLLKLESYVQILKKEYDQLEDNNRELNKKLKTLAFQKEASETDYQQKILKLESLVTNLEYQLRKLKNEQEQKNNSQEQVQKQSTANIERNYQSNTNTIRILHDGDVNIKIEGEALNKLTTVSVIQH